MTTESTQLEIDVPNFGKVPVQMNHGRDRESPIDITHRPPVVNTDSRFRFKNERIVEVIDPTRKSRLPQYAVERQKILLLTGEQLSRLLDEKSSIGAFREDGTVEELRSITSDRTTRIIISDCPDADSLRTVLLDWEEKTPFPQLQLRDAEGNLIEPVAQESNFLIAGSKDGPNDPPARPPAGALRALNTTQSSDFRPATEDDKQHYAQYSGQNDSPSVAVIDTGLKYNLHNQGHEYGLPAHTYRDADGQERRFTLAYQNQPAGDCGEAMAQNHLGYCALLSYRDEVFIKNMKLLATTNAKTPYLWPDVMNSPFDDFRLFNDSNDEGSLMDARHGTSVTALIQQTGDNAPVLPVKIFDNIGFATLFDVLNGFNYVLQRCKTTNIRVVNVSWIFGQDNPLIRRKIEQLRDAGVFVVAAAGNEGQTSDRSLDEIPVYPACYSTEFPNVITVTSIRKTYFRPDLLAPKQDSIIGKALSKAVSFGLFKVLEGVDDILEEVLPTAGYVAVENYSPKFVNVGVVSTFGYFRSPFWKSPIIRGSSYACALVSGFVIRQLRTRPDLLALITSGDIDKVRQQLLDAMSGSDPDQNLKNEYVNGGYYLDGYAVD